MNTGPVGHCLDHSNQPFGSMTVRCFLTTWHSLYQEWSCFVNTGLAYPLEFQVTLIWRSERQKFHSSVLSLSTDSCHSSDA